jgi:hypothetical protein
MRKKWMMLPIFIAGAALFVFVGGTIVQWLWNWLMPTLFGLREVTFWQAIGLLALSRILVGGFHKGGHRYGKWDRHMSPEEKERFRQKMRERCGGAPPVSENPAQ